jgi:hypothetical protein
MDVVIANRVTRGTASFLSASLIALTAFIGVVCADAPAPVTAPAPAPMPISDQVAESFYSSVSSPETIPQLLVLLVRLARSGVFSRWDFYIPKTA